MRKFIFAFLLMSSAVCFASPFDGKWGRVNIPNGSNSVAGYRCEGGGWALLKGGDIFYFPEYVKGGGVSADPDNISGSITYDLNYLPHDDYSLALFDLTVPVNFYFSYDKEDAINRVSCLNSLRRQTGDIVWYSSALSLTASSGNNGDPTRKTFVGKWALIYSDASRKMAHPTSLYIDLCIASIFSLNISMFLYP